MAELTEEQLREAARRAYEDGNMHVARELSTRALQIRGQRARNDDGTYGEPPEGMVFNPNTGQYTSRDLLKGNMESSNAGALGRGGLSGIMFNFDDEVRAAGRGARGFFTGEDGLGAFELERARAQQELDAEENGGWRLGGQVGGGLLPVLATAPLSVGASLGGTMARGGLLGLLEGGLFGAGRGEGTDRARTAGIDAATGGVLGLLSPALFQAGRGIYRSGRNWIKGTANPQAGSQALANTLRKSNQTPADVAQSLRSAAADGQGEYRLMDALGKAGQRRVSGIVRAGDDEAAEQLANYLELRQMDQPARVAQAVDDALGMGGRTAEQTRTALTAARDEAADINFTAARSNAAPVNLGNAMDALDDSLRGLNSLDGGITELSETAIGRKLARVRTQLQSGTYATIDFDEVLATKQELGRAIQAIKSRGQSVPPDVSRVYGALDDALEAASPSYRQANDSFRAASRVIDAVDEGAAATAPQRRAADTLDRFNAMTPDERAAARVGYGDRQLARVESNAAPTSNRARIFQSPKVSTEMGGMAAEPDRFARQMARETEMWNTQNRALQGSRTADNLMDIQAANGPTQGLLGAIRSPLDAVARGLDALAFVFRGENAPTRQAIAEALMSSDPEAALADALTRAGRSDMIEAAVEALSRTTGRETSPARDLYSPSQN